MYYLLLHLIACFKVFMTQLKGRRETGETCRPEKHPGKLSCAVIRVFHCRPIYFWLCGGKKKLEKKLFKSDYLKKIKKKSSNLKRNNTFSFLLNTGGLILQSSKNTMADIYAFQKWLSQKERGKLTTYFHPQFSGTSVSDTAPRVIACKDWEHTQQSAGLGAARAALPFSASVMNAE